MPDVTADILVQSKFAGDGAEKAATALERVKKATKAVDKAEQEATATASKTQLAFRELTKQIEAMGKVGAERSAEKVARLRIELRKLKKDAKDAGEEIKDLGAAHSGLDKATDFVKDMRIEQTRMNDEITLSTKNATVQQQLFDANAGSLGQYAKAAGLVGAAFAGGFAGGLKIAEKAGVSMNLTMDLADKALTKLSKTVNDFVGGPFKSLGFAIAGVKDGFTTGLLDPLPVVARRMEELREATERETMAANRFGEALERLGLNSKSASEEMTLFLTDLTKIESPAGRSREELDRLIMRFRTLSGQGGQFSKGAFQWVIDSFGLMGKTSAELATQTREATRETEKLAQEQNKAADAAAKQKFREDELIASLAQLGKQTVDVGALVKESSRLSVQRAENELTLKGATEERIVAFREAVLEEIRLSQMSAEDRLAAEVALAERIAALRIAALGSLKDLSLEEIEVIREKIAVIVSDDQLAAETKDGLVRNSESVFKASQSAEVRWAQMSAGQKASAVASGAQAGLGVLSAAFGEQKEVAIAQGLVNTYQSAVALYAAAASLGPVGLALAPIAAAAAVVAGLANVANIKSAEPAGGSAGGGAAGAPSFDVPSNDAAARFAGAMSARDLAGHFGDGFRKQMVSGAAHREAGNTAGPPTEITGGNTTIHLNGGGFNTPNQFVKSLTRQQRKQNSIVESRAVRTRTRRAR